MTEVAALASGVRVENRYDANLSYEERARLRREKRKQRSNPQQLVSSVCPIILNFSVAVMYVYSSPCSGLFPSCLAAWPTQITVVLCALCACVSIEPPTCCEH